MGKLGIENQFNLMTLLSLMLSFGSIDIQDRTRQPNINSLWHHSGLDYPRLPDCYSGRDSLQKTTAETGHKSTRMGGRWSGQSWNLTSHWEHWTGGIIFAGDETWEWSSKQQTNVLLILAGRFASSDINILRSLFQTIFHCRVCHVKRAILA